MKTSVAIRLTCLRAFLPCLLLLLAGCHHQDNETHPPPRPVKTYRIGEETLGIATSFAGEVKARYETTLSFRVPGKLMMRRVDVGDRVRQGEVLARLDASDYDLAVQALKAQIKSATAERDFARNDLARYRELLKQAVISPPDLERRETAHTAAEERVAALEAQLNQAANQLKYTTLVADRDGVVTALEAEQGQVVTAGQPVVKLARLDDKEIHFDIPEHRVAELAPGQEIGVTLWAGGGRSRARLREVAAAADPASRTYRVKATLLEGQDSARLGMTATAWLPTGSSSRLAIPLSALFSPQEVPEARRVWRVDERTGTVASMPVQTGDMLDGERITVTGLTAGQLIVSAGVQRLREGQAVRLWEALAAGRPRS